MARIIKDGKIESDPWRLLECAERGGAPVTPAAGDIIVPLVTWQAQRQALLERVGRLGVWIDGHADPAAIAGDLPLLGVVAVRFPKLTDGRGYTTARLLRERYGYRGELRAIGDVLRDQLFDLWRCGFNAFALRDGQDLESALAAFGEFTEAYQGSVERPQPLFRRRPAR